MDNYSIINNGIILPLKDNKGGVCTKKGIFIDESKYIGDWFKFGGLYDFDLEKVNISKERVIFLGYFVKQWGHFIVDCLNRSWFLCDIDKQKFYNYKIIFLNSREELPSGNYLRFFELLGFSKDDFITINHPTLFQEVIIPNISDFNSSPDLFFKPFLNVSSKVSSNLYLNENIYLSRCHFKSARKKEIGEPIIQKLFQENGFKVLFPETLSLDQQIAVFKNSSSVACVNGTIPLNVVFGNNNTNLIILNKCSLRHQNLENMCGGMNVKPICIDVYFEPIKNHPRFLGEGPFWLVPSPSLQQYFFSHNMSFNYQTNLFMIFFDFLKYYYLFVKTRVIVLLKKLYHLVSR